jgi:hypothetical protein
MCVSGEDADRLKKEGDSGDHLANKNLSEPPKATDEKPNETADLKTEEPIQPGNMSAGSVGLSAAADLDHWLDQKISCI